MTLDGIQRVQRGLKIPIDESLAPITIARGRADSVLTLPERAHVFESIMRYYFQQILSLQYETRSAQLFRITVAYRGGTHEVQCWP